MSESKAKKVEIKDVDGQTLSKLIDYIYTAEIEVTEENVQVIFAWCMCRTLRTRHHPLQLLQVMKEKAKPL